MIQPGATLGMLGGGQLGRMSIMAARHMGYKFQVFEPKAGSPAGMVADKEWSAPYEDTSVLESFAKEVQAVTMEFENVSLTAAAELEKYAPVRPGANILEICQNRSKEKAFLSTNQIPCAPFKVVKDVTELDDAIKAIGHPCVVKTATSGYDGKGQVKVEGGQGLTGQKIWESLGAPDEAVVEGWIKHAGEFSVICARNEFGQVQVFPVAENIHQNHILHMTIAPARISEQQAKEAQEFAIAIVEKLNAVGLITVELFLTETGQWVVNELAPRPHNSGHYSLDASVTSQFEQHIRAITGLPLGSTEILQPSVMVNLLGDVWQNKTPDWSGILKDPAVKLHLYDKGEPRISRKMGHFTVMAGDTHIALEKAEAYFQHLS